MTFEMDDNGEVKFLTWWEENKSICEGHDFTRRMIAADAFSAAWNYQKNRTDGIIKTLEAIFNTRIEINDNKIIVRESDGTTNVIK